MSYNHTHESETIQTLHERIETLHTENERLQQRIVEYEQSSAAAATARQIQTWEDLRTFRLLVEHAPDGITIVSLQGVLVYANPAFCDMFGYGDATLGKQMADFRPPMDRLHAPVMLQKIREQGIWKGEQRYQRKDGSVFTAQVSAFMLYDDEQCPQALMGIHRDITEQQEAEREREMLQQQVIEAQRAAIRELSTPLLPIVEDVVAMPLVGSIDSMRAQQIMETLLEGIVLHHATTAILDITGVQVVDTQVAQALIRTTQAVKLLGAHVILTGIQPQIAHTLVHLGVDLNGITTCSTLQSGIAYVLNTMHVA